MLDPMVLTVLLVRVGGLSGWQGSHRRNTHRLFCAVLALLVLSVAGIVLLR